MLLKPVIFGHKNLSALKLKVVWFSFFFYFLFSSGFFFWVHFKIKTKRYLRGFMVSSCYTELHTVGNLGTSLSCFSDSSSLPSNPTVTCCKGHGFGEEPAVVLGSRIPYDSTIIF